MDYATRGPVSAIDAALRCVCPRCGEGRLFAGYLTVRPACSVCGLDLAPSDSADGPAFFVMWAVGAIVAVLAGLTEILFAPPLWLHAVLWLPAILGGAALLLRPCKALLIALQYRHRIDFDDDRRPRDAKS
ncbi:MAG: DUF983 domain-containing protein [Alphaproteobacteria bacterium]|nr:DUF983 domain-containing protein [Alphaproteobacteria bacterium]